MLGLATGVASASSKSAALIWSPTTSTGTYSYGTVNLSQTASQTFTLINSGSAATSALSVTVSGSATFSKPGDTCTGAKLKPDQACFVIIQYAPVTGGQNVTATLTATAGKSDDTASLTLTGTSPDVVSVINPGNQTSAENSAVSLQIQASDSASGQTLTYSATGLPAGLSIDSSTGLISGSPTAAGPSSVTVTATDTTGAAGSATFTWAVQAPTELTLFQANPPAVSESAGLTMTATAELSGGDNPTGTITFSLSDSRGTVVHQETVSVNGDGTYTTPTGYVPTSANPIGVWEWRASYSGDSFNLASSAVAQPVIVTP